MNLHGNRRIGNKARGLRRLIKQHFPVPEAWVIPVEVHDRFRNDPTGTRTNLRKAIEKMIDPGKSFAVRSSGELEDSANFSFAGQFATILDVGGSSDLLTAVEKVWDSVNTLGEGAYFERVNLADHLVGMGVIIQEMIRAEWSGVGFSINPVTGRNETVIEGVRGSGDQLVQDGITPERWIFHQGSRDPYDETNSPPSEVLNSIADGIQKLRKVFGNEVDVEWAWDGSQLWYLQCRSVTTGKFPTIYSNHISREVLPGMIKPLVWSVNIPVVNSAWLRLLSGLLGKLDIQPGELSRSFYYRAYFNMGILGSLFNRMGLPRNSLESLMGRKDPSGKSSFKPSLRTMRYLPTMLWFLVSNLNPGRKFKKRIVNLELEANALESELNNFDITNYRELFKRLHKLAREMAYWNIVIPLTMQITSRMLQRKMEKRGEDFNRLDFTKDFPGMLDHDPKIHLENIRGIWNSFPVELCMEVRSYKDLAALETSHPLKVVHKELEKIISRFGHFSESGNDFSYTPWCEDPGFLFEMMRARTGENGAPGEEGNNEPGEPVTAPTKGRAYYRAGKYRLYREMISSSYTRSYGLFRKLFLQTGQHFADQGLISEAEQVFYLSLEEHDTLFKGISYTGVEELQKKAEQVKREMESYADISLPSVIYGDTPPPIAAPDATVMKGIPTSPGIFEGEIVVVRGYKDFKKEVTGKILVIPFSDVGWTPILSRAGAIVAESGGMLSHASIIARELTLPAVSSIDHACTLSDGMRARLDGYNGVLIIER